MGAPMDLTSLASELADKPAYLLAETGETLSYRDLEDRSNQVAHLFRSLGLGRGDHVAVLMENRLDLFPIYWAAQRSGLYYTPVNWHLTADEAAYIVDNCGATVLVSSADREELAAHAASRASALRHRLVVGGDVDGVDSLADRTADLPTTPVHDQSEGYYMFYSSGTTGRPKGILPAMPDVPFGTGLTLDHQLSQFGFSHDATYLSTGPLYHAAPVGWSMAAVRHGATAVVMTRFDAELTLAAIEDHQVTHAQFVPTMFVRMLKLPAEVRSRYDLSSLVLAIHAAAPCPVPVKEAMIEWLGPKVLEYYAGSEANCFFAISAPEWLSHKGSVGRAVIGAAHVLDAGGDELPAGEVGQLWFDGPGFEYHRDPDQTAAAHDARGWSTMGDLGWVDGEGYLYLADRRTDLIISGGVNIYPREVEEALAMHPCVQDIAVIGVPDDEMGQRVHAVVHAVQGVATGTELAAELVGAAARTIAGFKLPRSVEFVEDFPRLPSGKVLRRRLVDTYSPENAHRVPHPPKKEQS
ncbi:MULTISPECIES: AMP-binding protein [Arsenicicoccus]|uniref:AMP-binding protein n=1 Tax=Arsenicicoccus TaxID=267408 RepID=UPI00257D4E88|nr:MULTISPECIES: AMP-binding protein [Arsenicicoccus]